MNRDTIYVVITTHLPLHKLLAEKFCQQLAQYPDLNVSVGRLPARVLFSEEPYPWKQLKASISEHTINQPLQLSPTPEPVAMRIRPAIPDITLNEQVLIAVIGRPAAGKTMIMQAMENTLTGEGLSIVNIARFSMDYPQEDLLLTRPELARYISQMPVRNIQILFQQPRSGTFIDELARRCGIEQTTPEVD